MGAVERNLIIATVFGLFFVLGFLLEDGRMMLGAPLAALIVRFMLPKSRQDSTKPPP